MRLLQKTSCAIALCLGMASLTTYAAGAEAALAIQKNGSQDTIIGADKVFTGNVLVAPVFFPKEDQGNLSVGKVTFSPGARSAWHTHPAGQLLVVTAGSGWVQQAGEKKKPIHAGDVVWTPKGVKHWHGGTADTMVTHFAIQEAINGKNVNWLEKVADKDFGSVQGHADNTDTLKKLTADKNMVVYSGSTYASTVGSNDQYKGTVVRHPIFKVADTSGDFNATYETFTPGSHTVWQSFPRGQVLLVTQGRGWIQRQGEQQAQAIKSGDVIYSPAGVQQHYGADANSQLTVLSLAQINAKSAN